MTTIPSRAINLDNVDAPAEEYFLAPEKLLEGNPRQTLWNQYTDPSGQFCVGIWRSEPGRWHIAYTEEEFCQIIQGRSLVTDEDGNMLSVGPGDSFVIPRGFRGTWEVVETTTKRFVIYEAKP